MRALKGDAVYLRALEPEDIDTLYDWENDDLVWRVSNTLSPYSKNVLTQYLKAQHQDIYSSKQLRLVIETAEGIPVGCIDLFDFDPKNQRAGIGILIGAEQDKRRGYATEALRIFVQYCTDTLNLHQLYCNILAENKASLELFEKAGFVSVGIKKDWFKSERQFHDEYLLQKILS